MDKNPSRYPRTRASNGTWIDLPPPGIKIRREADTPKERSLPWWHPEFPYVKTFKLRKCPCPICGKRHTGGTKICSLCQGAYFRYRNSSFRHMESSYYIEECFCLLNDWDGVVNSHRSLPLQPIYNTVKIERGSCCNVLKSHHEALKDDPERLSTEFIKSMSQCRCKEELR